MKIKFLFATAAVVLSAACNEKIGESPVISGETVNLEVKLSGIATKATDVSGETAVNNIQIFVFGSGKKLEAYENVSDVETLTVDVLTGAKTIHALVNAPALTGIEDYDDLYTTVSSLQKNGISNFIMEGWKSVTVSSANESVTIDVKRLVSRVSLVKVENKLDAIYSGMTFKIVSAYLINVAGDRTYTAEGQASAAPVTWYSKMAHSSVDWLDRLTYASYNVSVAHNGANTTRQNFYCYPNPTSSDTSSKTWSARRTRLVVEVQLGGTLYYYPLTMPVMQQNASYQVSLTVTRPGSNDPDVPYNPGDASVTINVLDWVEGDGVHVEI